MDWKSLLNELQKHGLSQAEIGARLGRSQAWVSAVAQGKYSDLRWGDGNRLIEMHNQIVLGGTSNDTGCNPVIPTGVSIPAHQVEA